MRAKGGTRHAFVVTARHHRATVWAFRVSRASHSQGRLPAVIAIPHRPEEGFMLLVPATHDDIAALAYQYWLEEGQPEGRADIHWQRAYMALLAAPAEPVAKPKKAKVAAVVAAVSDVSLIGGVGPKIKAQLAAEGITSLAQIAAMKSAELEALDAKLGFKGRTAREEWLAQAKELVAGKPPRAKADKARV
jgi:predicted flap endonuclease-1-like 5' DNA nuclease